MTGEKRRRATSDIADEMVADTEIDGVKMETDVQETSIDVLLNRATPFGQETSQLPLGEFYPGIETKEFVEREARVLCIGAGGLGCELLKDLALSGFKNIHVIDLDTIDVTNLNRQFLFRAKDVGRMKAEVAAEFIMCRIPGVTVTPHTCPIQEKEEEFYRQFTIVIAGLDNIKARRWMNAMLHSMVDADDDGNIDPSSVIPFIDGGTEAFQGQARMIIPMVTSCFECSLDMFPPQTHFPLCTVAETPRKPDHCIAYVMFAVNRSLANPAAQALRKVWEAKFGVDAKLNTDDPHHMHWIYEHALERARVFGIEGVTYMLTMGVVKNIIPAVASTNAVIAAACCNEAFKAQSFCSRSLNTYFQYNGTTGLYTPTYELEKKAGCPVCDPQILTLTVAPGDTLQRLIDQIVQLRQLEKPSVGKPGVSLFMQAPPALRDATSPNLTKRLDELVDDGDVLSVTDPLFPLGMSLEVGVKFEKP